MPIDMSAEKVLEQTLKLFEEARQLHFGLQTAKYNCDRLEEKLKWLISIVEQRPDVEMFKERLNDLIKERIPWDKLNETIKELLWEKVKEIARDGWSIERLINDKVKTEVFDTIQRDLNKMLRESGNEVMESVKKNVKEALVFAVEDSLKHLTEQIADKAFSIKLENSIRNELEKLPAEIIKQFGWKLGDP